jgi:hypothetical protein
MADFKPGVSWNPTEALARAYSIAESVITGLGAPFVVTSGTDGKHSVGSLHYGGNAMDVRRWDLDRLGKTSQAVSLIRAQLGNDFDVILESDHIHIEYDPKGQPAAPGQSGQATAAGLFGLSGTTIAIIAIAALFLLKR